MYYRPVENVSRQLQQCCDSLMQIAANLGTTRRLPAMTGTSVQVAVSSPVVTQPSNTNSGKYWYKKLPDIL